MNNKGFTLVELLGTIVILAIIAGISSYSIITVVNNAKEKNYELLVNNIAKASEAYYQECYYGDSCPYTEEITLGKLVSDGYLRSNNKDNSLINPMTKEDISNCTIIVKYNEGKVMISPKEENSTCPKTTDYKRSNSLDTKNNSNTNCATSNMSIYGDANCDGEVDVRDIILMSQYVDGWSVDINLESADVNTDGVVDDIDVKILAKYLAGWDVKLPYNSGNAYNITYNLNGGKESNRNITRYAEVLLPYTLLEPTREGYVFVGWTGSNGNTPQKNVVITEGTTGDKNYIANWIMYGDADGDGKVSAKDVTLMAQYIAGWSVDINLESADVNTDGVVDDIDVQILAKYLAEWNIKLPYNSGNAHNITYNLNGGKESNRNITRYAEISLPYTLINPIREGYVFAGWTGSNGNTPQKNVVITEGTTGNKNYIANWIMYGDADGDGKVSGKDSVIMAQYVNGWSVNINLTAADVNTDGVVDDIDVQILAKYLAEWNIKLPYNSGNAHNITYNLNGGKESNRNITRYAEISLPYTLINPTREGYVFVGWTGSNGNTPQKNVVITEGTTGDKNYIANWIMYGDVNADGKVDVKDLTVMKQYINGTTNVNINLESADVNLDNKVDETDLDILSKYLAEWDIKLPYTG